MKKMFFALAMLLCSSVVAIAGNESERGMENTNSSAPMWEFIYSVAQPTDNQLEQVEDNTHLGKQAAFLFDQLQGLCVKRIPVVPGDPTTRIVIKKGELFNAVRKVSKGLEDEIDDNKISQQEAAKTMDHVLEVAISAFYSEDSKSFEKALRNNKKDYKQLVAVFSKVMLK